MAVSVPRRSGGSIVLPVLLSLLACAGELPREPPPLAAMEEPLLLQGEPADEAERAALPAGCFSGVEVSDAGASLEGLLGPGVGLTVARVVENSPAEAAGIEAFDLLLAVAAAGQTPRPLRFASEWRQVEFESAPGTVLRLRCDRAGAVREVPLTLVARVKAAARAGAGERLREEQRAGVVVRPATEVEARRAGLGPGGGAVVVGLSHDSPWRAAGVRFADLIVAVDGAPLAHPQQLLAAIRGAAADADLTLEVVRGAQRERLAAPLTRRRSELRSVSVPLLFSYEKERDLASWSLLLGLLGYESTEAAWEMRVLWLITFGGSQADELEVVDR